MYTDREQWNAWHRNRRRQIAYGRWNPQRPIDPQPVRDHITALKTFGLSEVAIARMSGHPTAGGLNELTNPNHCDYQQGITTERATRILAVRFDLDAIPAGHQVNPAGTRRRIEALGFMGWSSAWIANELGVSLQAVREYANPDRRRVFIETARKIRDLFVTHWATVGPNPHAARYARRHGWHGPLAWETIDDPAELPRTGKSDRGLPDQLAVDRLVTGDRFDAARVDQIAACEELTRRGASAGEIADQLDVSKRTIVRWRSTARTGTAA